MENKVREASWLPDSPGRGAWALVAIISVTIVVVVIIIVMIICISFSSG